MKYAIDAANAPDAIGPYSQGTTAGRLVFTSGQVAVSPSNRRKLIDGDVAAETERVIDIIEDILSEVDCSLADVAQTTLYLVDMADLNEVDKVYGRRFTMPSPARSVAEVSALPLGARVEIACVACR